MPRRSTAANAAEQVGTPRPSGEPGRVSREPLEPPSPDERPTRAGGAFALRGKASRERGARTRLTVVEALLELVSEHSSPPTALALAAHAGVSVRLLFHHYRDMEAIYEAAFDYLDRRHWEQLPEIPQDLPLGERTERTVKALADLFEVVVPLRRAAPVISRRRPTIADAIDTEDRRLRGWLDLSLVPEPHSAGPARSDRLHAIELVASCEAWDRLRRVQGLSVRAARGVMTTCLLALLTTGEAARR